MRLTLAISMGDPSGIGSEVIVKALQNKALYESCIPVIIGDREAIEDVLRRASLQCAIHILKDPSDALGKYGTLDLIDLGLLAGKQWQYKQNAQVTGEAAFRYVEKAIQLATNQKVDAVVTGPISKEAIHLAGHNYAGHTEIFADYTGVKDYAMLLASRNLRVIHVTTHVALEEACRRITKERVLRVIRLADYSMRLLGIASPRVAVAGLNPHSSENGLFGHQEADAILPAIEASRVEGILAEGPVPPDTVFVKAVSGKYDVVVAMYHDQGHIPLKLMGFQIIPGTNTFASVSGINCTIGLPFIRTSVDHGTAFDRAGDNTANEQSMVEAIEAAIMMTNNIRIHNSKRPH